MESSNACAVASEALQVLTEQVFANMKMTTPCLEELAKAAQKYRAAMEQANQAAHVFVDALAKVAVTASRSRAATSELGKNFQSLSTLHKQFADERDVQCRKFQTQFITPLQKRLKSEAKSLSKMEDDYKSLTKSHKSDMKKAGLASVKAQRSAAKKHTDKAEMEMTKAMKDLAKKARDFESFNQRCLRAAIVEERRRYCYLVDNYISVFDPDFKQHGSSDIVTEALTLIEEPEKCPASSLDLIEKNSSSGLLFEAADKGEPEENLFVPSPITRELQRKMSGSKHFLPPGCPPGGLHQFTPTKDQINPTARKFLRAGSDDDDDDDGDTSKR